MSQIPGDIHSCEKQDGGQESNNNNNDNNNNGKDNI